MKGYGSPLGTVGFGSLYCGASASGSLQCGTSSTLRKRTYSPAYSPGLASSSSVTWRCCRASCAIYIWRCARTGRPVIHRSYLERCNRPELRRLPPQPPRVGANVGIVPRRALPQDTAKVRKSNALPELVEAGRPPGPIAERVRVANRPSRVVRRLVSPLCPHCGGPTGENHGTLLARYRGGKRTL